jgi:hypothetical protein
VVRARAEESEKSVTPIGLMESHISEIPFPTLDNDSDENCALPESKG